ncbi:MAG: replicative DNA helicase [Abditibacteriales bacterium]|nr:replicative DNA helicase [Abditibacteriales bacterium]MDW8366359.1 replicative DNA helicase [Abditibacteriales bacterium]
MKRMTSWEIIRRIRSKKPLMVSHYVSSMATSGPVIPFPRSGGDSGDSVKVIPQSLEAEQSTLGAMLLDRDAIALAAERLKPEDFYREGHRQIFAAILHLFDRGDPADIVTVTNELRRRGQLDTTGGAPYLMTLMENCPAAANVEQYAAIVEEKAILRGLLAAADQVQGWVYEGGENIEALIDRAEQAIFKVGQRRLTGDFAELKALLHDAFEQIEMQFKHKGRATGIPTGFDDLDRLTSGLQPSDLIIVAARPSMGKTSLCLGIGHHVAVHEKMPVAIFSLEMSKSQLVQRLICAEARVNSQKFRSGYLDDNDWHKIAGAVERLYDAPIFIDDTPAISTFEMRAKARRLKAELGTLGLIIVDYLQLVRTSGRSENRVQEVSEIARSLKSLARELNVPLIALSQLSRAVEQREDKRPQLSDLRESGSIEAEADLVLFIHREAYYRQGRHKEDKAGDTKTDADDRLAEIIVGKQRNGPTGTIKLVFLSEYAKFESLAQM